MSVPDPSFPAPSASPWPHVRHGISNALGLPSLMLAATMIGVGGLCRDIGFPMGAGVASTLLIWAAPAQMLLFGSIASGVAPLAIAAAISLSSIRFVPMCMSVLPLLRRPGMPVWLQLIVVHYIAVTAWVESLRRLPAMDPAARLPYFLGFANTVMAAAAISTGVGYYLIGEVPPALGAALLFTSPVFFTVSLAASARGMIDWLALILGMVATPLLTRVAPAGMDLMIGGLGMGTLAYLIDRIRRKALK